MKVTKVPMCCGRYMWNISYDYQCVKCGSLAYSPAVCAHTTIRLGFCKRCGADMLENPTPYLEGREAEGWTSTLAKLIGS